MGSALGNQSSGVCYSVNKDRNDGYPSMLDHFWLMLLLLLHSACDKFKICIYIESCTDTY